MLKKIKVSYKILLMICVVALPLVGWTLFATVNGATKDIALARQEMKGIAFQRPLPVLLATLPQHKWLAQAAARGDVAARTTVLEKEVEIDQAFSDLEAANLKYGADLLFTDAELSKRKRQGLDPRSVKSAWQELKQSQATLSPADLIEQHQKLITAVRTMITHASDSSKLTLDPDLDSRYLVDATQNVLPQTLDRLGVITGFGSDLLRAGKDKAQPKDLAQLVAFADLLQQADVSRLNTDVAIALNEDSRFYGLSDSLQRNLTAPVQAYETSCQDLIGLLHKAAADPASVTADAFQAAGQQARSTALELWKTSANELETLLALRINARSNARLFIFAGVGVTLILTLILAMFAARSITRPLEGLTQATQRILRGDNTVHAPVYSQDEIGLLATSFNAMIDGRNKAQAGVEAENKRLQTNIQDLLVVVSDASDGKLGVRAKVSEGALGNVCDALNLMLENVGGIIANAKTASDQVAAASSGISAVAQELEKGEERQTQEINSTSDGVRDLNGKAQKVLENCQAANKAASNGRAAAELGAKAVREVIRGMEKIRENTQANAKKIKRLGDRSMEIAGIVKVIGDISAKTDMLALNASIEAARAGEQGRGFTVVAEQVRALADRTKTLTNQIDKLVNDIQKETGEAVAQMETQTQEVEAGARAAQSAGGTLDNIVAVSTESSGLVAEINQSASQQAARTQEMLATVESINRVVAESAVKVRETRSTSEQLLALSSELNKRLAQFEVEAEGESVVFESASA